MNIMENKIIDRVLALGAHKVNVIPADAIKTDRVFRDMCKANACGVYGKCYMCPPDVGDIDCLMAELRNYSRVLVYQTVSELEDSFDIDGMGEARLLHQSYDELIVKALEGENYKLLGAGGCSICSKCTYPERPCAFPEKAHPSVEACGINVVELSADLGINYVNGENTVTYFSVIFF